MIVGIANFLIRVLINKGENQTFGRNLYQAFTSQEKYAFVQVGCGAGNYVQLLDHD